MTIIERSRHVDQVKGLLADFPVVAVLGPRQVGKTTLARMIARQFDRAAVFDLDDSAALAQLEDPELALEDLRGLVVIDEIQKRPDLFRTLRRLADREGTPARFLILGSASGELMRQGSETLAGRAASHEISGLSPDEFGLDGLDLLWTRGGFPRSLLAESESGSLRWREEFIRTFLERDIPSFGIRLPAPTLRRFWTMLAHQHGQVWNASELGRAFGVADSTVRRYLDILDAAMVIRTIPAWHENLTKRQVRSPKVYVVDSGLLHALLRIDDHDTLLSHPRVGASWEGFAMQCVLQHFDVRREDAFFWGTHGGAELDLLCVRASQRIGYEFKRTKSPNLTPSMRIALADLGLDRLDVVHAGDRTYSLAPRIRAVPLRDVLTARSITSD